MAKYKLIGNGVIDTETGRNIPDNENNRHWKEYEKWLADGNIPDPKDPDSEPPMSEEEKKTLIDGSNDLDSLKTVLKTILFGG